MVRFIFERYEELGSVNVLKQALDADGIISKARVNPTGKRSGGKSWGRGALYRLLQNRIYLGEIVHGDHSYPGQHAAIVETTLWEAVQAKLATNRVEHSVQARANAPSLLSGLLYDEAGKPMSPSHACKGGIRYRYYVSRPDPTDKSTMTVSRIPAPEIERKVVERLLQWLGDSSGLVASMTNPIPNLRAVLERVKRLVEDWSSFSPAQIRGILLHLVARIELKTDRLDLVLRPARLAGFLDGTPTAITAVTNEPVVTLSAPVELRRCGFGVRLILPGERAPDRKDPRLVKLVIKAQALRQKLLSGRFDSIDHLAREENVTASYATRVLRVAFLAPDITKAILEGRQPISLTPNVLLRDSRIPLAWDRQKAQFGC